jgi:hypothetical protein
VSQFKGVLTIERHHFFSKLAWEHMLAYSILDNNEEMGSSEGVDDENKTHMIAYQIEKIAK